MLPGSTHPALRDRTGDTLLDPNTGGKPAILGRGCLRCAAFAALALVLYGTLGPLGYRDGNWLASAGQWHWTLASVHCDFNDVLTNLLVYLPVGLALRLLLRRRGRSGMRDLLASMTAAVALSYATELLQQFTPARSSNLSDVGFNAAGALAGCMIAPYAQRIFRRLHATAFVNITTHRWTVAASLAVAATVVLMTAPWNFTSPTFELWAGAPLGHLDLVRLGMFAIVGFLIFGAVREHFSSADGCVVAAIAGAAVLAGALEFTQAFIGARVSSLQHFLVACIGGLVGIAAGALRPRVRIGPITAGLALVATVGYVLSTQVGGTGHTLTAGLSAVEWRLPFQTLFMQPFERVMSDVLQSLALYAFLTLLALRLAGRAKVLTALVLLWGLVGAEQSFRMTFAGGVFDTTPFVIAGWSWAMTCYTWTVLRKSPQTAQ